MKKFIFLFLFLFSFSLFADFLEDLRQAETLYSNQNYYEALDILEEILSKNPYYRKALLLKGNIYYQFGEFNKAEKLWMNVYNIDPSYKPILFTLAKYFLEKKEYDKAKKYYNKIINIEPLNQKAKLGLAEIYIKKGQLRDANALLKEMERLNPLNPELYYQYGVFYLKQKKYDKAKQYFTRSKNIAPKFAPAYTKLGKIMLVENNIKAAEFFLNKAVKLDEKNLQNYFTLSKLYIKTKEWDKIFNLYKKIEYIYQNNPLFFYNYAVVAENMDKKNEMLKLIKKTLTLNSEEPFANLYYFYKLKEISNKKESQDYSKKYFKKAMDLYNNGNYLTAIQFFRKGLMLYPESSTNRYYYAICFKKTERFNRYLKELKIAISLNPEVKKWQFKYEKDLRKNKFRLKKMLKINPKTTPTKILIIPFTSDSLNTYHLNAGILLSKELKLYLNNYNRLQCEVFTGDIKNLNKEIQKYDFFIKGTFSEKENLLNLKVGLYSSYDRIKIKSFSNTARNNKRISVIMRNISKNLYKIIPFKGEIFKKENDLLYINLGKQDDITKTDTLVIFRGVDKTSFSPSKENIIDYLKIQKVYENFLIAKPEKYKTLNKIHLYDKVIIYNKKNDANK